MNIEIIYVVLMLHHAKKDITIEAVEKVLDSVGYKAPEKDLRQMITGLKDLSEGFLDNLSSYVRSLDASRNVLQSLDDEEDEEEVEGLDDLFGGKDDDTTGIGDLFG